MTTVTQNFGQPEVRINLGVINGNKKDVRVSKCSDFLRNKCLDTPKRAGKIISTSHFVPEGI